MSFKSKQRAKHGHLFGDDPLNVVSSSEDPLFSPPPTPLDSSSSTPVSRRTKATSSIFGDVDVAKLNGKRVSPSLRSTALRKFEDDDEEDLFGGNRASRSRVSSLVRQTSPEPSIIPAMPRKTSPTMAPQEPVKAAAKQPIAVKQPVAAKQQQPEVIKKVAAVKQQQQQQQQQQAEVTKQPIAEKQQQQPVVEEEDKRSFFASASRFFKSSSNVNSKASSTASSIASGQNSPKIRSEPLPQEPKAKPLPKPPIVRTEPVPVVEEEEEKEEYREIEDEATRAFADEVMSFQSSYEADYAAITPDLACMEVETKRLLPSVSTPTTMRIDVDPWFDGRETAVLSMEPSVSSPLHKVSVQDIEPEKRNAFADLITSWNTGQTLEPVREDREFFSQVAEEQHVGFASLPPRDQLESQNNVSAIDYDEENPWN